MSSSSRLTPRASRPLFHRVAIIGVGLIGGSLGLALKRRKLAETVVGSDRDGAALQRAVRRGAIDQAAPTVVDAVRSADLVVLATPVGAFESAIKACASDLADGALLTDVGSVKGTLVARIESLLPPHAHYVSSHPLAGRERSGIEAADPELFAGSRCLLIPSRRGGDEPITRLSKLWKGIGARNVSVIDPATHDRYLAVVSHLPHLVAYALVTCALAAADGQPELLEFSAGGFLDFTRIAASSPEVWRDICLENRPAILEALSRYQATLAELYRMIDAADGAALERTFAGARRAKHRWHGK